MSKKALLALMIAILLPTVGYLLTDYYSKRDTQMPGRYFYDSVSVSEKNGKTIYDTAWHHVSNVEFTNQFGKKVSFADLKGKKWFLWALQRTLCHRRPAPTRQNVLSKVLAE